MKRSLLLFAFLCSIAAGQSTEVQTGGQIVFRLRAPNAKEVVLAREGAGRVPMKKDSEGVWSTTVGPLEPDYYAYSFIVDGIAVTDPSNPSIRQTLLNVQSVAHVQGQMPQPWETQDVPHGAVHRHTYRSRVGGDEREYFVYTPPGYDARAGRHYPALYLQHGYGGDGRSVFESGPVNDILDNLIAQGRAKPMVAVASIGYGARGFFRRGDPDLNLLRQNYDGFRETLLTEVIPEVERQYRVAKDRNSRAIAGVSMGGAEALYVGLNATDSFAWIGAFSAGGMLEDYATAFPLAGSQLNAKIRLLWIACGADDPLIDANRKFRGWLDSRGVRFIPIETPGMHTWMVWRRNLVGFLPLLFR